MPSEMDRSLQRHLEPHLASGGLLELTALERFGVSLPMFRNAPPSLAHLFIHYCEQHGDAPFLVEGDARLSFAETLAAARLLASCLRSAHHTERGERVAIAASNSANWVILYMAVLLCGGCVTLLNGWWTGGELARAVRLAGCRKVLADPPRAQRLEGQDHGAQVLRFSHGASPAQLAEEIAPGGSKADPAAGLLLPGPDDPATILFTSGSTGTAKGVCSDHRAVVQATFNFAAQTLAVLGHVTQQGNPPAHPPASLVAVPLFHVTGEVPLLLQSFILGRKLAVMPRWDPLEALRLIERERITYFVGVPLMSHELATHPRRPEFDLTSCATFAAGGAPRPQEHVRQIRESIPTAFPIIGYGLTETNAVGCGNFNENYLAKPGSTGPASPPLVELAILAPDGTPLAGGETGEIAIRSVCNFLCYWNDPEATRQAMREDGFFLTGDLGYLDPDGYLFIVDRKKDIIIRGGENISTIEVEQAIYAHPGIAECAVFAVPDERLGEVPAAVILPREGYSVSAQELSDHLAEMLAGFKIPAHFRFASAPLPRLGTEKVDKRALQEKYSALSGSKDN